MRLHTVFITYNRLEYTKRAIESYLETVTVPCSFVVVDNCSTDGTWEWLHENVALIIPFTENRYPGFATNRGWEAAPPDATHLHRADNDFVFLPGWCDEVERVFENPKLGQLGLRTDEEERSNRMNVGGNCIIRRELWDKGLRYDERPWPEIATQVGAGATEDTLLSPRVRKMGYVWERVQTPCIQPISVEDPHDPYYLKSWEDRGLLDWALDAYGIER